MAANFDPVAVEASDERYIISGMALWPQPGRAVVSTARREHRRVESVDGSTAGRSKDPLPTVGYDATVGEHGGIRVAVVFRLAAGTLTDRLLRLVNTGITGARHYRVIEDLASP
ncbi:MAG TPA: hypothetical protein VNA27_11135 [Rubrobacteraceae bacterium]|nr:hypothetical protein [Rubrobacteraceae bacterium]